MRENNRSILTLSLLCVFSVIIMISGLCVKKKTKAEFIPPQFDEMAGQGVPSIDETNQFSWSEVYQDGMAYKTAICGNIQVTDGESYVYLTNYESNNVWLKLRIIDSNGEIVAETGLAKQGEYIEKVVFNRKMIDGERIQLKIMGYEPETYYSEGSIILNTTIHAEE